MFKCLEHLSMAGTHSPPSPLAQLPPLVCPSTVRPKLVWAVGLECIDNVIDRMKNVSVL